MVLTAFKWIRVFVAVLVLSLGASRAFGDTLHPLKPADRSSPRAALETFFASADSVGDFLIHDYVPSPSRVKYEHLIQLSGGVLQSLDLSDVAPAARPKTGRSVAMALYEILSKVPLPPSDEIPDADQIKKMPAADAQRWVIPDTEIALTRVQSGPHTGEFLFSSDTVARAGDFYEMISTQPYLRAASFKDIYKNIHISGGWMIPHRWIAAMPASFRETVADQSVWKWIGFVLILLLFTLLLFVAYRVSRLGGEGQRLLRASAQLVMPGYVLLAVPTAAYLVLVQLNFLGSAASRVEITVEAVMYLAGAWMAWRFASVIAETILASPRIATESVDAHLVRLGTRLFGAIAGATMVAIGADHVGVPVYGIVAGLGVGGLAVALAAQPTIENLIGGLNLFADKPVRVGDLCQYGQSLGTVEAIGIRSARIRSLDRTLTTIPNGTLAGMPIINFSRRDRILIQTIIGLPVKTTPAQLNIILTKFRALLSADPRVDAASSRARFVGIGASSLDIEVFAYVDTTHWDAFLGIREEILLRMMSIVEQEGMTLAFR